MTSKVFKVKVLSIDQCMYATLIDPNENDSVVPYELFIPAYFGGQTNPWPKVGEELLIRYNKSAQRSNPLINAWRPAESAQRHEAPTASSL